MDVRHDPFPAWAEGLQTQGHPLLPSLFLLQSLPPCRCLITSERRKGTENGKHRGKRGRQKTEDGGQDRKKAGRMGCGGRKRRRRDGGGAAHLQIKFVIQASDGPTARD